MSLSSLDRPWSGSGEQHRGYFTPHDNSGATPYRRDSHLIDSSYSTTRENSNANYNSSSADYAYRDKKLTLPVRTLSNGNTSFSSNRGDDFVNYDSSLKMQHSYKDHYSYFPPEDVDSVTPSESTGPSWSIPDSAGTPDVTDENVYEYNPIIGGSIDDIDNAFAEAFNDPGFGDWNWAGRSSVLPSKASKCLRASERINQHTTATTPSSHKPSKTTSSSSKSNNKSHSNSKGGHSSRNKKKGFWG